MLTLIVHQDSPEVLDFFAGYRKVEAAARVHGFYCLRPAHQKESTIDMSGLSRVIVRSPVSFQRLVSPRRLEQHLLEVYSEPVPPSEKSFYRSATCFFSAARKKSALDKSEVIASQDHLFRYWARVADQGKQVIYGTDLAGLSPSHLGYFRLSQINSSTKNGLSSLSHPFGGICTPLYYLGTGGSIFGIHSEDCDLCAISQLLGGASKFWVIIPPAYYDQTLQMLAEVTKVSYDPIRHKTFLPSTRYLEEYKIPYTIFEQRPGETMVLLSRVLHFGWNAGDNLSQSTNFWPGSFESFRTFQSTVRRCRCGCQALALSATRNELVPHVFEDGSWVEKNQRKRF